jgi:hypothetical protein
MTGKDFRGEEMKISDYFIIAFAIILIIALISGVIFLFYSTAKYWELRDTIKVCNQDFGEGKWFFTETDNYYSCKQSSKMSSIFQS